MTTSADAPSITEQDVSALSQRLSEPDWLQQKRLEAVRVYNAMSMPDPLEEEWRRTDISGLRLDEASRTEGDAVANWTADGKALSVLAAETKLPESFFFGDIEAGLSQHGDRIREHLHSLVKPSDWKLGALQAALWQKGTFVYVPRGVEVEVPLEYLTEAANGLSASHLLVIAEAGSSVILLQDGTSPDSDKQSLVLGAVEIFAAQDARVRFVDLARWGNNTYAFSTVRAHLERGAQLTAGLVGIGGRMVKTRLEVQLAGEGSNAELLGVSYGNESQHFDYITLQEHLGPRTVSDLLFKAALNDQSSEVWTGTVRIHKGGSASEANQTSRNLLLSSEAQAAPIPVLEIEAYDILRCSHGASAGPIDEEQLFYLEARAIPPAEAERLLVDAFFQQVVDRLPHETIRERAEQALAAKVGTL